MLPETPAALRAELDGLLDGLNPAQLQAVTHPDGPLLVVAGAGSGKTRVLTRRVAWLVAEKGLSPWRVLAITFTNKAADEMRRRVSALVGPEAERMWVSTFHSACVKILRREATAAGYQPGFSIYDQADAVRLTGYVIRDLDWDLKLFPARTMQAAISTAKNDLMEVAAYAERSRRSSRFERQVAEVYVRYQRRLVAANAMDFDDLLLVTVRLFREHPEILGRWQGRFAHVLVDEYQDTNGAQNELVLQLAGAHQQVTVVGDSDQSIYGWRGADISNILKFERAFPGTTTVVLDRNYRSSQSILDAANAVISNNLSRIPKNLWTSAGAGEPLVCYVADNERDEGAWVAAETARLRRRHGYNWGDIAIFYRTNAQSRAVEQQLAHQGIPYKVVGGTKFFERKEIKDLLAYLQAVANPEDEVALKRVLNVPRRGVGDTSVKKLETWAAAQQMAFGRALSRAGQAGIGGKTLAGIDQFLRLLHHLRRLAGNPGGPDPLDEQDEQDGQEQPGSSAGPAELLQQIIDRTGYLEELKAIGGTDIEVLGRLENVQELIGAAQEAETLQDFLTEVSLVADADEVEQDEGSCTLMTLHTAKGLEYPVVFIVGLEENIFPHFRVLAEDLDLEEERRLCYVGLTRAKQRLYLTLATSRSLWGQPQHNQPSRFVAEIPPELMQPRQTGTASRPGLPSGLGPVRPAAPQPAAVRPAGPAGQPARSSGAERLGLQIGDAVVHDRYGRGIVLRVAGAGADAEATVKFPGAGLKRFLLSLTPLRRA
jgi:DNA helicase-2/ATP-dependent DNA helicase PcrA